MAIEYKNAGVDVEAGYEAVKRMKEHVQRTMNERVVTDLGGFGGLFSLAGLNMEEPILVSGTDGVGTKVKLAFLMDKHDTVGIDAVAMCVNDVICCGASPLFFLDYIACGKNEPAKIAEIVKGVAEGCVQSHSALIGGETAEHPGLMPVDEYDIAGFSVGKVFGLDEADAKERLAVYYPELGATLGETLITPTKIYVQAVEALGKAVEIKAISHITGGGFYENIPRMLPKHTKAVVQKGSWDIPPIFSLLQKTGEISEHGMFNTFNMGIGMLIAVAPEDADKAMEALKAAGQKAYVIGTVEASADEAPEAVLS